MFSQVSVCLRGVSTRLHAGIHTPPGPEPDNPPGRHPLPSACWDTPPCAVHAGIRSTSGLYASHWNAFLFGVQLPAPPNVQVDKRTKEKRV